MSDDHYERSPIDNPISNTGFRIINGRKASHYVNANNSPMYQSQEYPASSDTKNQLIAFEPCWSFRNSQKGDEDETPTEVPILTCLNGIRAMSAKQVDAMIEFQGFLRGETANEHVKGNVNGTVPIILAGVFTIVNSGIKTINPGAFVRLRAPSEEEARHQSIVGRTPGKVILMTEEYKPEFDAIDEKSAFTTLMKSMGVDVGDITREVTDDEIEIFNEWWIAARTAFAVFYAEFLSNGSRGRAVTQSVIDANMKKDYQQTATALGLVTGKRGDANFQIRLLKRLFVMNLFNGGMIEGDTSQLIFQLPNSSRGQSAEQDELAQLQATSTRKQFSSIISGHSSKLRSIKGKAPFGAEPGQSMEFIMWST